MKTTLIKLSWLALAVFITAGCSTNKERLLTHGDQTMLDIWNVGTADSHSGSQSSRQLLDARQSLRRPLTDHDIQQHSIEQASYTRNAQNEISNQFQRLPNPDLVMYIFPHLAGSDPVPVPGYSTIFPLYQRVQYAMPGERLEPY
ncbi:hypothetical protein CUZ56_01354 [Saezia sanguinis]|uniref:Lipoprotein n=1 Tax=Saezia sanguinis TaxID=1965230 RepID=A0A433SF61_9BURK|nr:TIGR03751 family conjugal transfer lipoprotein [Saezia sanguinis]RUS67409.1 hypothetical protein CUZ56_01354 [Saezia sanguinis]